MLYIAPTQWTSGKITAFTRFWPPHFKFINGNDIKTTQVINKIENCESIASYINLHYNKLQYFQLLIILINLAVLKRLDKTQFFKSENENKFRQKRSYNNKLDQETDCCEFFLCNMNDGTIDYMDIVKNLISKSFLNLQNLQQIYNNCYQHFCATNSLDNVLQTMLNRLDVLYM